MLTVMSMHTFLSSMTASSRQPDSRASADAAVGTCAETQIGTVGRMKMNKFLSIVTASAVLSGVGLATEASVAASNSQPMSPSTSVDAAEVAAQWWAHVADVASDDLTVVVPAADGDDQRADGYVRRAATERAGDMGRDWVNPSQPIRITVPAPIVESITEPTGSAPAGSAPASSPAPAASQISDDWRPATALEAENGFLTLGHEAGGVERWDAFRERWTAEAAARSTCSHPRFDVVKAATAMGDDAAGLAEWVMLANGFTVDESHVWCTRALPQADAALNDWQQFLNHGPFLTDGVLQGGQEIVRASTEPRFRSCVSSMSCDRKYSYVWAEATVSWRYPTEFVYVEPGVCAVFEWILTQADDPMFAENVQQIEDLFGGRDISRCREGEGPSNPLLEAEGSAFNVDTFWARIESLGWNCLGGMVSAEEFSCDFRDPRYAPPGFRSAWIDVTFSKESVHFRFRSQLDWPGLG